MKPGDTLKKGHYKLLVSEYCTEIIFHSPKMGSTYHIGGPHDRMIKFWYSIQNPFQVHSIFKKHNMTSKKVNQKKQFLGVIK